MKIFKTLNKKLTLKTNLEKIRAFNKEKLETQKEELIEWEKDIEKQLKNFELTEDTESELLSYISLKFNNLRDMQHKIEDFEAVEKWFQSKEKKNG